MVRGSLTLWAPVLGRSGEVGVATPIPMPLRSSLESRAASRTYQRMSAPCPSCTNPCALAPDHRSSSRTLEARAAHGCN